MVILFDKLIWHPSVTFLHLFFRYRKTANFIEHCVVHAMVAIARRIYHFYSFRFRLKRLNSLSKIERFNYHIDIVRFYTDSPLDDCLLQTKQATGARAKNTPTRLGRSILPNPIFPELLQPAEDDSVEAVHHVLAQP